MNQLQYRLDQEILKTNQEILKLIEESHQLGLFDIIGGITFMLPILVAIYVPYRLFKKQVRFEKEMIKTQNDELLRAALYRLIYSTNSVTRKACRPFVFLGAVPQNYDKEEQFIKLKEANYELIELIDDVDSLGSELYAHCSGNLQIDEAFKRFNRSYQTITSNLGDSFSTFNDTEKSLRLACSTEESIKFFRDSSENLLTQIRVLIKSYESLT
jgi:hypothetical protein